MRIGSAIVIGAVAGQATGQLLVRGFQGIPRNQPGASSAQNPPRKSEASEAELIREHKRFNLLGCGS